LKKAKGEADSILHQFLTRLRAVKILDPACGSGNFLYVALLRLKDLEQEAAVTFPSENGLNSYLPGVSPSQLYGIEINSYAHDLAQMTVWIGWLQWIRANGFGFPDNPILRPLTDNIRRMDAILKPDAGEPPSGEPVEPEWPAVDFIIGNPPFLGDKLMRRELGDGYVDKLRALYAERIPGQSDLCCYWFEKARAHIAAGKCRRAGLLATQSIRGGANREVLKRIKDSGGIFWAQSDRPWVLDGANVHVSMVAFDDGAETTRTLDGKSVPTINADLTATADTISASVLNVNAGLAFLGNCKGGAFDIDDLEAFDLLSTAGNPHAQPNSDVIRPVVNSEDLLKTRVPRWFIDSADLPLEGFTLYEKPFHIVRERVKPNRDQNRDKWLRENWWRPQRMRPEMRNAVAPLPRFLVTPTTAKHRIFIWLSPPMLPDHQLIVFGRSDDVFLGIMHSRFHEIWALRMGTRLETRPRYTPTTCFETFPFPTATADQETAIAAAARERNQLRENWLNPPDWTRTEVLSFPGTVGGPWDRYIDPASVADRGAFKVGTVRYPRLVPLDAACAVRLKDRTLTKLYNERPAWLADCHARLDAAVAAAYGWPADLSSDSILERLLALNQAKS
jgi:type II restriction/modification system DNA methylase subunit YeeA